MPNISQRQAATRPKFRDEFGKLTPTPQVLQLTEESLSQEPIIDELAAEEYPIKERSAQEPE